MRSHPLVFLVGLLLAVGAGFGGGLFVQSKHPLLGTEAEPPAGSTSAKSDRRWDEKMAVHQKALLDYLDGKEIQYKQKKRANGTDGKPLMFRKADIEAVKFDQTAAQIGNGPWDRSVTLVGSVGGKRYAVRGDMEYREIDDAHGIAIVSFTATEVSPQ